MNDKYSDENVFYSDCIKKDYEEHEKENKEWLAAVIILILYIIFGFVLPFFLI